MSSHVTGSTTLKTEIAYVKKVICQWQKQENDRLTDQPTNQQIRTTMQPIIQSGGKENMSV